MTIYLTDGFEPPETNNFENWTGKAGVPTIVGAPVHSGEKSMLTTLQGSFVYFLTDVALPTDAFFRFYVYPHVLNNTSRMANISDSAYSTTVGVNITNDGSVFLVAPSGTYDSAIDFVVDRWRCIEFERKTGAGTGLAKLWIDGNLEVNLTTETISGGAYEWDLGQTPSGTGHNEINFDDAQLADIYNGLLGEAALGTFLTCLWKT